MKSGFWSRRTSWQSDGDTTRGSYRVWQYRPPVGAQYVRAACRSQRALIARDRIGACGLGDVPEECQYICDVIEIAEGSQSAASKVAVRENDGK